jgi:tetratricopeptide (TPR) repeat protein
MMSQRRKYLRAAVSAVALAVTAGAGATFVATSAYSQNLTPSQATTPALQEALALQQAGDFRGALAKLDEANAVEGKTAVDTQIIEQMRAGAFNNLREYGSAATATQRAIDAGHPQAQTLSKARASLLFQAGDHAAAVQAADAYISQYGADSQMIDLKIAAASESGDNAAMVRTIREAIAAAGGTPSETRLQQLLSAAYAMGDMDTSAEALQDLVRFYPKESYWRDYIGMVMRQPGFNQDLESDAYRLMAAAGVNLTQEERVTGLAEFAMLNGNPGEAVTVLEEGLASGAIPSDERMQRLLATAKERAAADQPTLGAQETEARAAATGQPLVAVGEAYLGYGDSAKAAELIQAGIEKGGVTNENMARLHLGIAQKRAGDPAANATFESISGEDGAADLAQAWLLVP